MAYNKQRGLPWHGLGNGVEGAMTAHEAITAAGLDWEVELRKLYTTNTKGSKILVPGHFAVTRDSDESVLGVVKSRYTPFQNRDAFGFADNIVDSGDAKYDTAGALRNGRVVFLSMVMPEHIMVGGEDAHSMYLLLRTSHDGSKAISVYVVVTRVVCMNTLTIAERGAKYTWSMPHVSTLAGKVAEARDTLALSFSYADDFSKMAERLMSVKVSDDKAVDILEEVLPVRPKTDERIENIMDCLRGSTTNGYHGTGWGLVNAITEYHEHWQDRQAEARFFNVIDGEFRKWRNSATAMLLQDA